MGVASSAVGVVLLLFGGLLVFGAAAGVKRWWDFRRLSVVPGRDVEDRQLVGLSGTVKDTGSLESPFSGTDCVAQKWIKERRVTSSDRGRYWDTRRVEGAIVPFDAETDDGTPVSVVPPDEVLPRSHLEVGTEALYTVEPDEQPPATVRRLIDEGVIDENDETLGHRIDESFETGTPLGTRRYRERAITAGDDVWLYGRAEQVGAGLRLTEGSLFVVSDSAVATLQEQSIGQAVVLALAGAMLLLFAYGFLM